MKLLFVADGRDAAKMLRCRAQTWSNVSEAQQACYRLGTKKERGGRNAGASANYRVSVEANLSSVVITAVIGASGKSKSGSKPPTLFQSYPLGEKRSSPTNTQPTLPSSIQRKDCQWRKDGDRSLCRQLSQVHSDRFALGYGRSPNHQQLHQVLTRHHRRQRAIWNKRGNSRMKV